MTVWHVVLMVVALIIITAVATAIHYSEDKRMHRIRQQLRSIRRHK